MKGQKTLAGIVLALLLAAFFQGLRSLELSSERREGVQNSAQNDSELIPPVASSDRIYEPTESTRKKKEKRAPSIQVQTIFVEIHSENTGELGFDWLMSPFEEDL